MKKFLLSLAMFACTLGAMAADGVTAKVSGTSLNIGLTNETSYVAFQMDITLPEGVSASEVAAAANRLSQEGSDTSIGGTKFIVASNVLDGNKLRVIAYNLANAAISGTSGDDILNITLNAAVADPTTITIDNIIFVTASDLAAMTFENVTGENGAVKGDVNGDGSVDVSDVVAVINAIKSGTYNAKADVNNDNSVDVSDAVGVINIIKQ